MCDIKLYSYGDNYKLYHGNMLDMLAVIEPNSIDAIVTDPPYELNFMGKNWDNSGIAFQKETWEKCLKVLKPGGYLLSFGGSRTFHRIACAIEDAGFEIRDTIMYLYGTGFPKSMNIAKGVEAKLTTGSANKQAFKDLSGEKVDRGNFGYASMWYEQGGRPADYNDIDAQRLGKLEPTTEEAKRWQGFGTALKPAYEPIIVARKPCEGSCIDNVLKYGVGGINIDECRVPHNEPVETMHRHTDKGNNTTLHTYGDSETDCIASPNEQGRFPANVILTYDETDFDEVCGGMPYTEGAVRQPTGGKILDPESGWNSNSMIDATVRGFADSGSAARYFYCAKASKRDRDEGLPDGKHNIHPTVKNTMLMQYLVRLVTPKGGTILDPFNGSGSTGKAVMYENGDRTAGYKYIGIELTLEYLPIADARIRFAIGDNTPVEYSGLISNKATPKSANSSGQISLFDENT